MKKGHRYSFRLGRRIQSGEYLGKYKNSETGNWHYHFRICFGMYSTPEIKKTKVLICTSDDAKAEGKE